MKVRKKGGKGLLKVKQPGPSKQSQPKHSMFQVLSLRKGGLLHLKAHRLSCRLRRQLEDRALVLRSLQFRLPFRHQEQVRGQGRTARRVSARAFHCLKRLS